MLPKIETPRPSRHLVLYTSAAAILFFFFFFFFFLFLFFLGGGSNHNSIKNDEGFGLDEIKKYIPMHRAVNDGIYHTSSLPR